MTVQLTYTKNIRQAVNGQVAYDFGTSDITSANSEGAIPFGNSVVKGVANGSVIVGNTLALILGVATRSLINDNSLVNGTTAYADTETVSILREGYIFLENKGTIAIAEGENANFSAAGVLVQATETGTRIDGSRVEQGGAVGEICLIKFWDFSASTTVV